VAGATTAVSADDGVGTQSCTICPGDYCPDGCSYCDEDEKYC
jgi:hypothetical protein